MNKITEIKKILLSCCLLTTCGYCSNDAEQNEAAPRAEQQLRYPQSREEAIALGYTIVRKGDYFEDVLRPGVRYAYICNDVRMDRGLRCKTLERVVVEGGPNRDRIPSGAFIYCINLKEIVLPDSVKSIEGVLGCPKLARITLPPALESIGNSAFDGCTRLALTELPPTLESIGEDAFCGCTNLALTALPPTLKSIGNRAFFCCTRLALTELPTLNSIGESAFYRCTRLALTELPPTLKSIGWGAFHYCTNLALTELPPTLESIGEYAFDGCTRLALTALPPTLKSIGNNAFHRCTRLALTELPPALESIGNQAFQGCTRLALTELPPALKSIGRSAFHDCKGIKMMTVQGSVRDIRYGAFACTGLTTLDLSACNDVIFLDHNGVEIPDNAVDVLGRCIFFSDHRIKQMRGIKKGCEVRLPRGMGTWKNSINDKKWNKLED
jgi:hypothetical protein